MTSTNPEINRLLYHLREYCRNHNSPNWLEYHILDTTDIGPWIIFSAEKQRRKVRMEEHKKIEKYCDLVHYCDMTPREAEAELWPESVEFYKAFEKEKKALARELAVEEKQETEDKGKKQARPYVCFYLERKLSRLEKDRLLDEGFRRLKISPFGEGGAAYYLVKKRYNESKEHAFFCYLIESELRKRKKQVELFVNDGPDIVFRHRSREYCIDVETGSNLARDKDKVERKFAYYRKEYYRSYVFVTNKKLKHKYKKFGIVITRGSLRKALSHMLI